MNKSFIVMCLVAIVIGVIMGIILPFPTSVFAGFIFGGILGWFWEDTVGHYFRK